MQTYGIFGKKCRKFRKINEEEERECESKQLQKHR